MEIRSITDSELLAWRHSLSQTFGVDTTNDPQFEERAHATLDLSRTFAAFDRGNIVATAAGFDFALAVPGGSVPMSGLTMVTVRPTHRRRGILRALIQAHVEAARAHGDPLSGLWASEATIYGRFGYGIAAECDALAFNAAGAKLADGMPRDEVEIVSEDVATELMPPVYDRAFAQRPGLFSRTPAWWRYRRIVDRADQRAGSSSRRFAVVRRGDEVTGYLMYRQRLAWEQGVPAGALDIDEMLGLDARAEATLWSFVASVDLFPRVAWLHAPVDMLLPWIVDDRRRLLRRRAETLWLRVDDVARTLAARTYGADGTLVLEVEGTSFVLTVTDAIARCEPADAVPDLRLDRSALGTIYLGGFPPSLIARAGRIVGDARALARADRMFASDVAPWCAEIF